MKRTAIAILIALGFASGIKNGNACTNFLVTKGASTDGSTMISYSADSHVLFGELYYWPAQDHTKGSKINIYEWDTGKYLGKIEQVEHTYAVTGNMNEHQLAIGETTYTGRRELQDTTGIIDYGSLIYLTLQRAKTAREAIQTMTELVDKYGYYSTGESFSISDPNEVWIMEMIGKGPGNKGAVWVAIQIPDGYICAHANQARITTFPIQKENNWNDKKQTVFHSSDVISFAREKGFYEGRDKDFSFSDVYAPVSFGGARFCEMRVYSFFKDVSEEIKNNDRYWAYVKGHIEHEAEHKEGPLTPENFASNRMPLYIKPDRKISARDVMNFMRDHLEGTELDMRKDMGAGPFECPYRWRPLRWKVDSVTYCNERATATQQTGFTFVTQSRSWLPDPIGGIFWFAVDDAASAIYVPFYCGILDVPETYAPRHHCIENELLQEPFNIFTLKKGGIMDFNNDVAFWVFNQVTNWAYTRYNYIHPEIDSLQDIIEGDFARFTPAVDKAAKELYDKNPQLAQRFLTDYSIKTANRTVARWKAFYAYLFTKYMDGNIKWDNPKTRNPNLKQPGYGEDWYRKIVDETREQFEVIGGAGH